MGRSIPLVQQPALASKLTEVIFATQDDKDPYHEGLDAAHQYGQYGSGLQGGGCDSRHHTHVPVLAQGTMLNSATDALGLMQPCIG